MINHLGTLLRRILPVAFASTTFLFCSINAYADEDRELLEKIIASWVERSEDATRIGYEAVGASEFNPTKMSIVDSLAHRAVGAPVDQKSLVGPMRLKFIIEPQNDR